MYCFDTLHYTVKLLHLLKCTIITYYFVYSFGSTADVYVLYTVSSVNYRHYRLTVYILHVSSLQYSLSVYIVHLEKCHNKTLQKLPVNNTTC